MSVTLDDAIAKMQATGDWSFKSDSVWSDKDIAEYEEQTGLQIPDQLAEVLKHYGWNGFGRPDKNALFLAEFEDGTRSTHEVQVLVSARKRFYDRYEMFITEPAWPDQFTLPMVFFGSADGGHSYLLMDGRDRKNNAVFIWEQASDPFGTGNNARGLGRVAPSLYEFFYNLKTAEEV